MVGYARAVSIAELPLLSPRERQAGGCCTPAVEPELSAQEAVELAVVTKALEGLRAAAQGDSTLMPSILDAVRADATLGEICGTLRDVFGEYQPPTTI